MRKPGRWCSRGAWAAAVLCAVLASGPPPARAQSVEERIQMLEKQLEMLKKELADQKARAEKQEKAVAPLADVKKTVEALSKLEISGRTTGTVQSTSGVEKSLGHDESFAVGALDLFFTYKHSDNVKAVVGVTAIGGDGPDVRFPTFSILNAHAGSTSHPGSTLDDVSVLEAYIEATFFQDRLTLTAGKIDLTNYFDTNVYANNKKDDFLSVSFTNTAVLSNPANGPGVRARYVIVPDLLYAEAGAINGDRNANTKTTDKFFEDVYGIGEIGLTPKIFGRQGNYRFWAFADGAAQEFNESGIHRRFTSFGTGLSFDQELADWLGAFVRVGYRDSDNLNYSTQAAWTAGFQLMKLIPGRSNDVIGFGYGEIRPIKRAVATRPVHQEGRFEAYYRWHFADNLHFSPFIQYVEDRQGAARENDFWIFGARLHLNF